MLSAAYANQTILNVKLSKKLGAKQGGSQKSRRAMAHPGPLRTATVALSLLCDVCYSTMEKL